MAVTKVDNNEANIKSIDDVVTKYNNDGVFNLSSDDIAAFQKEELTRDIPPASQNTKVKEMENIDGSVTTELDIDKSSDVLFSDLKSSDEAVQSDIENTLNLEDFDEPVVISRLEKENFLDAVVSGDRYTQDESIYCGRCKVTFRSRQIKETTKIYSILAQEYTKGIIKSELEYGDRLKQYLLLCQIESYNGLKFKELSEMNDTLDKETGEQIPDPEQVALLAHLDKQSPSVIVALFKKLVQFEKKYWTMVNNADDQNFWNPEDVT